MPGSESVGEGCWRSKVNSPLHNCIIRGILLAYLMKHYPPMFIKNSSRTRLSPMAGPLLPLTKLLFGLALLCATSTSSLAQNPASAAAPAPNTGSTVSGVPDIVANGFLDYMKGGFSSAVEAWSKGSSLEVDSTAKNALSKSLSDEENVAGTFVSPEIIRVVTLSTSSTLVYIFGKYQRGSLFMCFACYKTTDKWLVTSVDIDVDPVKVLPTNLLSGQ